MKPGTADAMRKIIADARAAIPFDLPEESICSGVCHGCAKKLLEFLDAELCEWESRLNEGEVPKLGDVQQLGKCSRKIYKALQVSLAKVIDL